MANTREVRVGRVQGLTGKSAYELAVETGTFTGTLEEYVRKEQQIYDDMVSVSEYAEDTLNMINEKIDNIVQSGENINQSVESLSRATEVLTSASEDIGKISENNKLLTELKNAGITDAQTLANILDVINNHTIKLDNVKETVSENTNLINNIDTDLSNLDTKVTDEFDNVNNLITNKSSGQDTKLDDILTRLTAIESKSFGTVKTVLRGSKAISSSTTSSTVDTISVPCENFDINKAFVHVLGGAICSSHGVTIPYVHNLSAMADNSGCTLQIKYAVPGDCSAMSGTVYWQIVIFN